MPQVMLVLVMVPGRKDLLLPRRDRLLEPGLLLQPHHSFLLDLLLYISLPLQVADRVLPRAPVPLIERHGVLLAGRIELLLSHAQVLRSPGQNNVLDHRCQFVLLHGCLVDVLLIDHIGEALSALCSARVYCTGGRSHLSNRADRAAADSAAETRGDLLEEAANRIVCRARSGAPVRIELALIAIGAGLLELSDAAAAALRRQVQLPDAILFISLLSGNELVCHDCVRLGWALGVWRT